jgi:hypothetical protein
VDWGYVAGILDGEGTVAFNHPGTRVGFSVRISIAQSGNIGRTMLQLVNDFLHRQIGVSGEIYSRKNPVAGNKDIHALYFFKREEVKDLLSKLMPYLIIKKVVAQDSLRMLKLYRKLDRSLSTRRGWITRRANATNRLSGNRSSDTGSLS